MRLKFVKVGDYVQVTKQPDSWEGSGENADDLRCYVGHVGIVVEVDLELRFVLCRFPSQDNENETAQRNIEWKALQLISAPTYPLTRYVITEERT